MDGDPLLSALVMVFSVVVCFLYYGKVITVFCLCFMAAMAGACCVGLLWVLIFGAVCVAGLSHEKTNDIALKALGFLFVGLIGVAVLEVIFGWYKHIDNIFFGGIYKIICQ